MVLSRINKSKVNRLDLRPITILSVEDHDLVRKGLAAILSTEPDLRLVAEASTAAEAIQLYRRHRPGVTLMDLRLPDKSGIETTREIRAEFPEAKIIALTSYDGDQDIYRALEAGIRGYLLKEVVHTEVIRAIRIVHFGKRFIPTDVTQQLNGFFPEVALTPRETQVLSLVARGFGNKEIGDMLGTASGTVKAHVQSILSKLDAKDRTHAVTIALRRGIIHLHSPDLAAAIQNG
ncbi:MAG: response regulator transcription factor [Acidobacteriaceae bacterium]|nr:response regulator transcription factor [Acidobacteriaceae bacterium]MBV9780019.1 response regulator transcription factor [Acidobacteriaceae bacterium]